MLKKYSSFIIVLCSVLSLFAQDHKSGVTLIKRIKIIDGTGKHSNDFQSVIIENGRFTIKVKESPRTWGFSQGMNLTLYQHISRNTYFLTQFGDIGSERNGALEATLINNFLCFTRVS